VALTKTVAGSGVGSYGALGHVPLDFQQFHFSALWSKSDSQLLRVCEISWCRCPQLVALSIITTLVIKLLVIEQLLQAGPEVRRWVPYDLLSSFAPPRNKSWRRHSWSTNVEHAAIALLPFYDDYRLRSFSVYW